MANRIALVILVLVLAVVTLAIRGLETPAPVTLDQRVPLWKTLQDGTQPIYISAGTECRPLDNALYKFGAGDTTLYYYKVNCNGVKGYVARDNMR